MKIKLYNFTSIKVKMLILSYGAFNLSDLAILFIDSTMHVTYEKQEAQGP